MINIMSITSTSITDKSFSITDTLFKKTHEKYSNYATEFKKINISRIYGYNQDLSFKLNILGDLLHRCFLQIKIPKIEIYDSIINNSTYITFKKNKLKNIQNKIDFWTEEYNNFYNYVNIQIIVYIEIKKIYDLKNITLDFFQSKTNAVVNDVADNINDYKLLVDANIINQIDIIGYINNLTSISDFTTIKQNIDKQYNNINNYLNYYYSNKIYYENKYNIINEGKIFYKWIDNLSHHFFTHFEFDLDGHIMDNYSNDLLHIYQQHNIINDMKDNYNKLIGNNENIYNNDTNIYTPLLFWFCKDISNSLPLVSLMNSSLQINTRINKLENLIYFQDWDNYYYEILTLEIPRDDHDINDENNIVTPYDVEYDSIEIKLPENIYIYKCSMITKKVLDIKFPGINSDSIINNYGTSTNDGIKYLPKDKFIYIMNNLKTNTLLSENTKMLLGDYHYFIDYNYLLNIIPKPNVQLIAEYCYVDDVEKKALATNKLNYLTELHNEVIIDINNNSIYDSINEFNGLVKDIYYFTQKKLNLEGISRYGKSEYSNYENEYIDSIELKVGNENNIFQYNENVPYLLLESQLPDGVKYITFSLTPTDNIQPHGVFNMTSLKGQNIEIILKDNYSDYYNNINNPNNLGSQFKLIYTKYNYFQVENGKGKMLFY
jgi:hypothetical protein